MTTLLYILGGALAAIVVWAIATPSRTPQPQLSPDHIEDFFRNPANFAGVPIERIFDAVGRPLECGSMDFGISIYDWRTSRCKISVMTQGEYPICVQMRSLNHETEAETVWEYKERPDSDF
ncbi:hypothetical protein ABT364_16485 [Massilia sp. SR12]